MREGRVREIRGEGTGLRAKGAGHRVQGTWHRAASLLPTKPLPLTIAIGIILLKLLSNMLFIFEITLIPVPKLLPITTVRSFEGQIIVQRELAAF